jgi:uncharacterized protein (DUF427 family)
MMSLTAGWGPLGEDRRGRFDFDPPERVAYWEDYPRRVRGAVEATWHVEDEQVFGDVRDPYHRLDIHPTSRLVRISLEGELLAESQRAQGLFETGLPPRWYLPREDVRAELERSEKVTVCAYKGFATHWTARSGGHEMTDVAWSYENPLRDAEPVRDLVSFYNERVDIELDGEPQERPRTVFS